MGIDQYTRGAEANAKSGKKGADRAWDFVRAAIALQLEQNISKTDAFERMAKKKKIGISTADLHWKRVRDEIARNNFELPEDRKSATWLATA